MITTSTLARDAVSLETVNKLLLLDGKSLYEQSVLSLHTHFQTETTQLLEIDKLNYKAVMLAYAGNNPASTHCYMIKGSLFEHIAHSKQEFSLITEHSLSTFAHAPGFLNQGTQAYLGLPIKAETGEVLGLLFSTFTQPIEHHHPALEYHRIIARLLTHSLRNKWLYDRSESLIQQLSYEISHDNLTHLLNRDCLSDKLDYLLENNHQSFTLAYLDIDNFKAINDLFGHYIGDQVIKYVANTIFQCVYNENLIFRIAGDEFAFITSSSDPLKICQMIIERLQRGYRDSNHHIKVRLSIGLAKKDATIKSSDQLILNASLALKECKSIHNQPICCYDTHLSHDYHRRTQIINALRIELDKSLENAQELYVNVQPIVQRSNPEWHYFEVLARWENPQLGTISPVEFIDAAEQSGLIVDLGERIVELACQAKKELERSFKRKIKLAINCSVHEIAHSSRYLKQLMAIIGRYQFHPDEFTIELTETVLLSKTAEVSQMLGQLRELGFKVALDDFGTGYSSLNYIHSYPIDCIKIDATFIRNMLCSETSERVVWLIIQLAKQLKVDLIAEGVENQQALDKLYAMGCEQIQGYYFSKPALPSQILQRWHTWQAQHP